MESKKFINPFDVSYEVFVKALGNKSVKDYCKGKLADNEIEWLTEEVKNYKINIKNKK
tara:strand:+ start:1108 stop:1281 length:174 start_codon:yes stop_codon:yes gene_type:complete